MSNIDTRPEFSKAAEKLAQARAVIHSDPAKVIVHVRELESLLGELEGQPELSAEWENLIQSIRLVEDMGQRDVDSTDFEAAFDKVKSAYERLVDAFISQN